MRVNMFTKEEMHADQAEFRLFVLISKIRARSVTQVSNVTNRR